MSEEEAAELFGRVATLEAKLAAAEAELALRQRVIEALQKMLFGRKSERLDPAQLQLLFGEEVLGKPEPAPSGGGTPGPGEEGGARAKRHRRGKAELFPRNLPVHVEAVLVPAEVAADPGAYEEIGEEHHDLLDIRPAQMRWLRKVLKKFVPRGDRSHPPLKAPAPPAPVPGTLCSARLAAAVAADKYCDHLPHYRQSARLLRRHGAQIGRQTLNAWTHALGRHLAPVGEAIKRGLGEAGCLQVDETPLRYLNPGAGKAAQGYLWVYRDADSGAVYYDWQLGRGHDCLLGILGVDPETSTTCFQGTLQCDGYSAYEALATRYAGVQLGGCLSHVRRKFVDAIPQAPEAVMPVVGLVRELYQIEGQLKENRGRAGPAPPQCRMLVRLARARPLLAQLKDKILAEKTRHLPQSALGAAITYALGQWEGVERYLYDGRLEIDNNLVENAIRPPKLGAKNYLFFGSAEAGKTNALFYTLVANCKVHGIDPESYFEEVALRLHHEDPAALTPAAIAAERAATRAAGEAAA